MDAAQHSANGLKSVLRMDTRHWRTTMALTGTWPQHPLFFFSRKLLRMLRHIFRVCPTVLILSFLASQSLAQGSKDDYQRAEDLPQLTSNKVFRDTVEPTWFAANKRFWYRVALPGNQQQFIAADMEKGEKSPAFDHDQLAAALAEASGKMCEGARLPFNWIRFNDAADAVSFRSFDKGWSCALSNYEVTEADIAAEPPQSPRPRRGPRRGEGRSRRDSPDGKWEAFVRDFILFVRNKATQEEFALGGDAQRRALLRAACLLVARFH